MNDQVGEIVISAKLSLSLVLCFVQLDGDALRFKMTSTPTKSKLCPIPICVNLPSPTMLGADLITKMLIICDRI